MQEINNEPYWPGVWNHIQSLPLESRNKFIDSVGADEYEKIRLAAERVRREEENARAS